MMRLQIGMVMVAIATGFASADMMQTVTSRVDLGANDSVDWGQLAHCQGTSNPAAAVSAGGLGVTASDSLQNMNENIQENPDFSGGCPAPYYGWGGNFAPGNNVLATSGALTLAFSSPVEGVGAQIASNFQGAFTAELDAYDGTTLLGSFQESGDSTGNADNSAIFMGLQDLSGANITSAVFSIITDPVPGDGSLGINTLSLETAATSAVPEPRSALPAAAVFCMIAALYYWRRALRIRQARSAESSK